MVHDLNRAMARMTIFENPEDVAAILRVVNEAGADVSLPILAFTAMPNHWHFVVRPASDDQVNEFFRRPTVTHTTRWHAHDRTGGTGHSPRSPLRLRCLTSQQRHSTWSGKKHTPSPMQTERTDLQATSCILTSIVASFGVARGPELGAMAAINRETLCGY